jgi:hypothetical protein
MQRVGVALLRDAAPDHHGRSERDELARLAHRCRRESRALVVVAGDQTPQPAFDHDGDRHRGADAHVGQVLAVDRGDGARRHTSQVERKSVREQGGDERARYVRGVGDDPQGLREVERPCLRGDVCLRVVQPEERFETLLALLGDDHPVAVVLEAVGHHAIEPRQRLDEIARRCGHRRNGGRLTHPCHRPAHRRADVRLGLLLRRHRFELDDPPRVVARRSPRGLQDADVEGHATSLQPGRLPPGLRCQRRDRRGIAAQHILQRSTEHVRSRGELRSDHHRRVRGDLHHPATLHHHDDRVRLHGSGDVDRLRRAVDHRHLGWMLGLVHGGALSFHHRTKSAQGALLPERADGTTRVGGR